MTSITIVTPWLHCRELAPDYERAVAVRNPACDRVRVVDNGGAPRFTDRHITYVRPPDGQNVGFSKACNLGLEHVETDAVLFLNNDVRMTSPDWLERIRAALQPNTLVGAELRADPHTVVDGVTYPYLDGWCIAALVDTWHKLGCWDGTLREPSYWGDNILAARARQHDIRLVPVTVGLQHLSNYTSRRMAIQEVSDYNRAVYESVVRGES